MISLRGVFALLSAAALVAQAAPTLDKRDGEDTSTKSKSAYSLPISLNQDSARTNEIEAKRAGWLYGPDISGDTAYYPTGKLGNASVKADVVQFAKFQDALAKAAEADAAAAGAAVVKRGNITSLDEYHKIYDGLWSQSAPAGPMTGMLTNYTSDLLFSMERLSVSPISLQRMKPEDELPFQVDNTKSISTLSLEELLKQGRLFLIDYSDHQNFPLSKGKYAAACQAYFYIHPKSEDFLPLAIKPNNEGSDLIFTPEDEEKDWTMAKMLFEMNDFWHIEWYHYGGQHSVAEIVYLASKRTLSESHPVMALLNRVMHLAWSVRQAGVERLLNKDGPVDSLYAWDADVAKQYTASLYKSGVSGSFQSNYFDTKIKSRGLINPDVGPELKSFPFKDDVRVVLGIIRDFMTTVVDSYYTDENLIKKDQELQNWAKEANQAKIIDFPESIESRSQLVDVLSHQAYLVAIEHGILNTNSPVASTASFPLHPACFYKPIPTQKGQVDDIMTFMPPLEAALGQISLVASFNRAAWEDTGNTLRHMFDEESLLSRMNQKTREAEKTFQNAMNKFSDAVSGRTFDENGLSQGMPFIWDALDPNKASYFLTI